MIFYFTRERLERIEREREREKRIRDDRDRREDRERKELERRKRREEEKYMAAQQRMEGMYFRPLFMHIYWYLRYHYILLMRLFDTQD